MELVTSAGRPRRTPATTPRATSSRADPSARQGPAASARSAAGSGGEDGDADSRRDPPPSYSELERAGQDIAAAAAALRHRLVMGRYAGFAAGFDAGLAMCSILDTLARDRGRDMRSQRLRMDALRLAHHVNQDVAAATAASAAAADAAAIEGAPPTPSP